MRVLLRLGLLGLLGLGSPLSAAPSAVPTPAALEPASTGGLAAVDRALVKLSSHRRLLVVGAHPDDEDNALLAWVGHGLGGEGAYFSLSRGEGGQNLIGSELGVGLGLLRTGELLAARRIEGTRQLFARAFDFGYTRSLEETARRWPRELLLEDAVRATRRFKPQVVVAVFPPDARAGHGQHQMAGVIARELFETSGEPGRFPRLTAAGLPPWSPRALYRRAWRRRGEEGAPFSLDAVEPFSGRSVAQIAAAARSMHRSQDMGREQPIGGGSGAVVWVAGGAGEGGDDPFTGIDTRLAAIADSIADPTVRAEVARRLERVEGTARAARGRLAPARPEVVAPDLASMVSELTGALELLAERGDGGSVAARQLVEEKLAVAETGLAAAAGIALEAVAARPLVPIGGEVALEATVWNAGASRVELREIEIGCAPGWRAAPLEPSPAGLAAGELAVRRFRASVAADAEPTVPYFLRRPRGGDLYDWSGLPEAVLGEPYQPPPLTARFALEIEGVPVRLEREVVYRTGDQALGEVRRPLAAVPAVEVGVHPELVLVRTGESAPREIEIALTSNADGPLHGRLEVAIGGGFRIQDGAGFAIAAASGQTLRLKLTPPERPSPGAYAASVAAVLESGKRFAGALPWVDYPHVRPVPMPAAARFEVRALDLELPVGRRIGYVRGASDRVPEMLAEVGLPVELLDEAALRARDLSVYDAVVVGSRAYETEPVLARVNGRLLEYARGGGLLLVQYQQYAFAAGDFAPWPLSIARPHGRVTDEGSPVEVLRPDHPVLTRPNRLGADDWSGWVQERGLYFADTWDQRYTPLLSLHDPEQPAQRGGLLVARTGEGWYVYTGLAFFRQLPAGVPGAYRLMANLLALADLDGEEIERER